MIRSGRKISLVIYGDERGEVLGKFMYVLDGAEYTALKKHLSSVLDHDEVADIFAETLEDIANMEEKL